MYCPPQYAVTDRAALSAAIRDFPLATIIACAERRAMLAYAPVVVDENDGAGLSVRFHLARANPAAALLTGCELLVSFRGPDAYISPNWYRSASMVPTWNYIAIEGRGRATRLDRPRLRSLLEDLSAQEEAKLQSKQPWTTAKVAPERYEKLLDVIEGFVLRFDLLEGKFKLSQEKSALDFEGAIAGLEEHGHRRAHEVATAMRRARA